MVAAAATLAIKGALGLARALGPAGQAEAPGAPKSHEKARKTANEFETMFLEQMLERMMEAGGAEGPLGDNGTGGGVYRSMLVKEYAGAMGKSGGIGLSDSIFAEILKIQEGGADVGRT
jgi:Rod binding domain-containing protein